MNKLTSILNKKSGPAPPTPNITLYFLQTSRAIRTAWLLEELGLDYKVEYFDREPTMDTPASYREKSGFASGRSPAIRDGNLSIIESAAIAE
jgi:glutathione S-transferase